jgi:NTE family protein
MDKKLAFVLSGGGARGALQVGAMYALLEVDLKPDLLIGTSIGAANASFIAMNGFSRETLDRLTSAWIYAQSADMLPSNYIWLTMRAMFRRPFNDTSHNLRRFFITHGLIPELSFGDITQTPLVIVSSDLNTGRPILHGVDPTDKVLDALLLSTALPPWFMPVQEQNRYLVDGGIVSNLPIEPALNLGATEIVALDLMDARQTLGAGDGVRRFIDRLIFTVERRQVDLEMQLAEARGVPVLYLGLVGEAPVPLWDFQHSQTLIHEGYEIAQRLLAEQRSKSILVGAE